MSEGAALSWPESAGYDLKGARVLVTGAGGGIGSAAALRAAKLGASVLAVDLQAPAALASFAERHGAAVESAACDIANRTAVEALLARSGRIDALVDAAGICPYDDWREEGWDETLERVLAVNLRGPINLVRAAMDSMSGGGGRIVLAGSLAGRTGGLRSGAHYAAAKGGVHALVRWFALKGAPLGILVNAVAPGTAETPMTAGRGYDPAAYPLKRLAKAEEIAAVMLFLCMPASSFMTGAVLDVNGGIHFS